MKRGAGGSGGRVRAGGRVEDSEYTSESQSRRLPSVSSVPRDEKGSVIGGSKIVGGRRVLALGGDDLPSCVGHASPHLLAFQSYCKNR